VSVEPTQMDVFRSLPLLTGLEPEAFRVLVVAAEQRIARTSEVIVQEGEVGNRFFILGRGSVLVLAGFGTERETPLATLKAPDIFGEMCLVESFQRSATIVTAEPVLLYTLTQAALKKFSEFYPQAYTLMVHKIALTLAGRLLKLDRAFAALSGA
jgi:CRP-like cAMP-binding protein